MNLNQASKEAENLRKMFLGIAWKRFENVWKQCLENVWKSAWKKVWNTCLEKMFGKHVWKNV